MQPLQPWLSATASGTLAALASIPFSCGSRALRGDGGWPEPGGVLARGSAWVLRLMAGPAVSAEPFSGSRGVAEHPGRGSVGLGVGR